MLYYNGIIHYLHDLLLIHLQFSKYFFNQTVTNHKCFKRMQWFNQSGPIHFSFLLMSRKCGRFIICFHNTGPSMSVGLQSPSQKPFITSHAGLFFYANLPSMLCSFQVEGSALLLSFYNKSFENNTDWHSFPF